MRRQDLAHVLRAACDVTEDPEIVVMGSQAILGSYDEDELPALATASVEADLAWLSDGPNRERADRVNGEIGEMSMFDEANGYYPEGISIETAILPEGWRERLRTWELMSSHPARPSFLDKYDLAIAKLAAHRPKDLEFVGALVEHQLLDVNELRDRGRQLPSTVDPRTRDSVLAAVESFAGTDSRRTPRRSGRDRLQAEKADLAQRRAARADDASEDQGRGGGWGAGDPAGSPRRYDDDHPRHAPHPGGPTIG